MNEKKRNIGYMTVKTNLSCALCNKTTPEKPVKVVLDRSFDVFNVIMMIEGAYYPNIVGINEKRALYFSSDDLQKSVSSWNGRPASLRHPLGTDSINHPEIFDKQWIGLLFNANYNTQENKLEAELWLDKERGSYICDMIQKEKQIDVSLGAYGDIIYEKGETNGIRYEHKMTNISGDHLAVLPDEVGACSWEDGCGIRAVTFMAREIARTPLFSETETIPWTDVNKTLINYVKAYNKYAGNSKSINESKVENLPQSAKRWISSKTILGDENATTERDLILFPVVNPNTDKLNSGALQAVLSGRGSQSNISSVSLNSAREKTKSLLNRHFPKKPVKKEKIEGKEHKTMSNNTETEFDYDKWLDSAPKEISTPVKAAIAEYSAVYEQEVKSLINCASSTDFKESDFVLSSGARVPLPLIKKILSLANKYNNLKANTEENKLDFGVRSIEREEEKDYAPFTDIDWMGKFK